MAVQAQQSHSGFVPSLAGVGGFVYQSGMASISDGECVRIVVEEITPSVIRSWYIGHDDSRSDVSTDVPAAMRNDYGATIRYWTGVVQGWAPAAA